MVEPPIVIITELIVGIVVKTTDYLFFILSKLFELFQSLSYYAGSNILGFLIAATIGTIVVLLVKKEIFRSFRSIIFFALIFIALFLILAFVFSLFFVPQEAVPT